MKSRFVLAALLAAALSAQPPFGRRGGPQFENLRQAGQLLRDGKTAEALAAVKKELETNPNSTQPAVLLDNLGDTVPARKIFQHAIAAAADPAAKAQAQRAMAMSSAFD